MRTGRHLISAGQSQAMIASLYVVSGSRFLLTSLIFQVQPQVEFAHA